MDGFSKSLDPRLIAGPFLFLAKSLAIFVASSIKIGELKKRVSAPWGDDDG
jgi:hypothetical protein